MTSVDRSMKFNIQLLAEAALGVRGA